MIFQKIESSHGGGENIVLPTVAHFGDAGWDLFSAEDVVIPVGENRLIHTGVSMKPGVLDRCVGLVCSRSGIAARNRVFVLNAPGIVDSGYSGEVMVNLMNLGSEAFTVKAGMRIGQLVVVPAIIGVGSEVVRGDGGHGSTGV